jgi:hypothetical protein
MLARSVGLAFACAATAALVTGCGPAVVIRDGTVDPTDVNLATLGRLYARAQQQLGRPPKNVDELKPYAKDSGDLGQILVSANDGQPFVIAWGASVVGAANQETVIAYERTGANGFRHVLTPTGTQMLTAEEFAKATFPPGHKPAGP